MDTHEIKTRIRKFLLEEFPSPGVELSDETNLLDDYFLDSFGVIETVLFLESSFGVKVARADINGVHFKSIASLAEFVAARTG